MPEIKLEVPAHLPVPQIGEHYAGGVVVCSFPELHDPNIIIDLPEGKSLWSALAVDSRPVHEYTVPPWKENYFPQWEVGDTFPLIGVTSETQARGRRGAGVIVAVADTGLDANHAAFEGIELLGDARVGDTHGHGTHVASTAASHWGIAPDAAIYVKNVLPGGRGSETLIANGLRKLADDVARDGRPCVLNLSLGGTVSSVIDAAVRYCQSKGLIVVAAAGNSGDGTTIGSPARASDLVVGACDRTPATASFTEGRRWAELDCYAPGVDIRAAAANRGSLSFEASGTSMAAPHVAGVVALLLAGGVSPKEMERYIHLHQRPVKGDDAPGMVVLGADFGEPSEPFPGEPPELLGLLYEARSYLDEARYVNRAVDPKFAWGQVGVASDALGKAIALLEDSPDPPPVPEPEPVPVDQGFTAPGHHDGSPACDWYPVSNGSSKGWELRLPVGCTVSKRVIMSPLGTPIYVAGVRTDTGLQFEIAHVEGNFQTGYRPARELVVTCWDSGIEFERLGIPADASHFHIEPPPGMTGLQVLQQLGINPALVPRIPGPQDYLARRARAGRFL